LLGGKPEEAVNSGCFALLEFGRSVLDRELAPKQGGSAGASWLGRLQYSFNEQRLSAMQRFSVQSRHDILLPGLQVHKTR